MALARLLAQPPAWVFCADAALRADEGIYSLVRTIFAEELADTAIVATGNDAMLDGFYTRALRVHSRSAVSYHEFRQSRRLAPSHPVAAVPAPAPAGLGNVAAHQIRSV